jgi:hypothetical protein
MTQALEPIVGTEDSLSDITQLTSGFERAGEAYFSPDMNWIIFQATPKGEKHYAQYVAKLTGRGQHFTGLDPVVRISPPDSRNTCGYFSPDMKSLIFASTAGKEDPNEPTAGYQRQGGTRLPADRSSTSTYQLLLATPAMSPSSASWRKQRRQSANLRR